MKDNDKINVSLFLKDLNKRADEAITYHHVKKDYIKKLTCKELAQLCEVTPATISNLNTHSSFYLIFNIAGNILDSYYALFDYEQDHNRKEYPDELIEIRDINYVIKCLTTYYSTEWLSY